MATPARMEWGLTETLQSGPVYLRIGSTDAVSVTQQLSLTSLEEPCNIEPSRFRQFF